MFAVSQVECLDLARSSYPISTGVGFLDHMLDQFNSHAQIGVAVTVQLVEGEARQESINRHAACDQGLLQDRVGTVLGTHMKPLIDAKVLAGS